MAGRIYFDNAATTPPDPRVFAAAEPYLARCWGNASSLHQEGREAREGVETARRQVADLIGAEPGEIVFTSGGTEADALAIHGAVLAASGRRRHVLLSAIEHPAVLECCRTLEGHGVESTTLPVDGDGIVDPAALRSAIRPETCLVSIMAANNVVGTIQPVTELAQIARDRGVVFHTDAVQSVGKIPTHVKSSQIDLLSLSAHKLHGFKGAGALYVREGIPWKPLLAGGGQEHDRRPGTENVAGIVALGAAAEIARREMSDEAARLVRIRDFIIDSILASLENAYLIGHRYRRLPGHACFGFERQEGEAIKLLLRLDEAGFAVSTGSACSGNHAGQPSHVLQALGFDPIRARGSLRITLGRFNTAGEAQRLVQVLPEIVRALRPMAGVSETIH
jgi:cysteine desulfurase